MHFTTFFVKLNLRNFHIIKETVVINMNETKELTISFKSETQGIFKAILAIKTFGIDQSFSIVLNGFAIENTKPEQK